MVMQEKTLLSLYLQYIWLGSYLHAQSCKGSKQRTSKFARGEFLWYADFNSPWSVLLFLIHLKNNFLYARAHASCSFFKIWLIGSDFLSYKNAIISFQTFWRGPQPELRKRGVNHDAAYWFCFFYFLPGTFLSREGNQICIGFNSYFFKYFICSFPLFFFLGKSIDSLRFSVKGTVFDIQAKLVIPLCSVYSSLCSVLTSLCCNKLLLDLFSPWIFEFLQSENQVFINSVPLRLSQSLIPTTWSI